LFTFVIVGYRQNYGHQQGNNTVVVVQDPHYGRYGRRGSYDDYGYGYGGGGGLMTGNTHNI